MANPPATRSTTPNSPFQTFIQTMSLEGDVDTENGASGAESMVTKVVVAETEEQMWAADELDQIGGRDLIDVEMLVRDIHVRFSSRDDMQSAFVDESGRRIFLLVDAQRLDNGDEFTFNTGAPSLVSKLYWLSQHGALPKECVIRGTTTANGTFLKLKPLPKRAIKG